MVSWLGATGISPSIPETKNKNVLFLTFLNLYKMMWNLSASKSAYRNFERWLYVLSLADAGVAKTVCLALLQLSLVSTASRTVHFRKLYRGDFARRIYDHLQQ